MGSLMIPCKSSPLIPLPSDFSQKPIKATLPNPKTHQPFSSKLSHLLRNGSFEEAITALDSIAQNGSKLKTDSFTHLLDCCIDMNLVEFGRELHARMYLVGGVDPFVETKLIGMYAKCGYLDDARKVFDEMSERNLFSWSAIIGAYSRERRWKDVLGLFGLMVQEGMLPDSFLLPKILQACGNYGDFDTGRVIHSLVIRSGFGSRSRVNNALLGVYAKCGELSLARRFFEEMEEKDMVSWNSMISGYCQSGENDEALRLFDMMYENGVEPGLITWNILVTGFSQSGDTDTAMQLMKKMKNLGVTPDVFTWTSMISGLSQNSKIVEALELFREMILVGVQPNGVTIASAISGCATIKCLEKGKEFHAFAVKIGLSDNVLVGNAVIDMYSKCGELDTAHEIFDQVFEKDVYTWNSMIGGYIQAGYCGKAYDIFTEMQKSDVKPNVVTWNLMISGYIQKGDEDQAMDIFHKMGKGEIVKPNTSSWNSLIAGYLQIGLKNKALGVFRQMQYSDFRPNAVTILTILNACADLVLANKVKEIHASVIRRGLDSQIAILNSLIDTYAKSGNIMYSKFVFDGMSAKDIITWNSLIAGYVLHGCTDDALNVFDQMKSEGRLPNRGTCVSLILAYSRAKMIEKGKQIFHSMTEDYHVTPGGEHYSAMVDLFGRSGSLKDASKLIKSMEIEPDSSVWEALLTASRYHGNLALTIHAGEHILKMNPGNSIINHLVSQAYSLCENSLDPLKDRISPVHRDPKRDCGLSLLGYKNAVYSFVNGDFSPGFNSLYTWLKNLAVSIERPVSSGIHEEEEEEICGIHSEKLAIAFALISTQFKVRRVRIVKNVRMCEQCHHTIKHISSLYNSEILLHDSKCLHHFKNGRCSCGDYW